jgi:glycosyltransferase involved in cell wall biosynthesis
MASGLPIITTRCEGVEELIKDNGFIVENAQAEQIADAIKRLAEDRETYRNMSAAARQQAEKFSWNSVAERYLKIYESCSVKNISPGYVIASEAKQSQTKR